MASCTHEHWLLGFIGRMYLSGANEKEGWETEINPRRSGLSQDLACWVDGLIVLILFALL